MTTKVFWQDPYAISLNTRIISIAGNDVTLAQTILYAFSGGQERDHGTIAGRKVLDARKQGREIIYTLDSTQGLAAGEEVYVALDWERRYMLMRLHFAAELVLELTYRACLSIEKIGAHIAQDKARIDFAWPESLAPLLPELQAHANLLIAADHPIISAWSDQANERRYWEIAGFARVSCGGTHIKRTGEIGAIALKRKNVGRGKERIEIVLHEVLNRL